MNLDKMRRVRVRGLEPRWLDVALVGTVVASIVAVALGSSSIAGLVRVGRDLRWVCLAAFALAAFTSYVVSTDRRRLDRAVTIAGLVFVGLVLISTAWSVTPRLTAERALSIAVVLLAVGAAVEGGGPKRLEQISDGILIGTALVVALGVPVLLFDRAQAVQSAFENVAPRYRGIGENPNTVSLLAALAVPLAVRHLMVPHRTSARVAITVAFAGLLAQIAFSDSRGALAAAFLGGLIATLLPAPGFRRVVRQTVVVVGVTVFALVVARVSRPVTTTTATSVPGGGLVQTLPGGGTTTVPADTGGKDGRAGGGKGGKGGTGPGGSASQPVNSSPYNPGRLEDEVGAPSVHVPVGRPFGSGRLQAWVGGARQAAKVPLLGYGFGTEDKVFIDRFYTFQGSRPENSYIGLLLQVGLVGLASVVVLLIATLVAALRRGRDRWREDLVLTGALAASCGGALLMIVQSYVYSAGNIASLTFWLCIGICAIAPLNALRDRR
jgi:hypothetical protein